MPLTNGSGSGSWILLFSSQTFKMPTKYLIFIFIFSADYFLKVHLHHFSKLKSQNDLQNSRKQGFSYYFCMMIEGSGGKRSRGKCGSEDPVPYQNVTDPQNCEVLVTTYWQIIKMGLLTIVCSVPPPGKFQGFDQLLIATNMNTHTQRWNRYILCYRRK